MGIIGRYAIVAVLGTVIPVASSDFGSQTMPARSYDPSVNTSSYARRHA